MPIEEKTIKCPNCGVVLNVRNSKNEAVKIITCPQCKATLSVKFKRKPTQEPLEAPTFYADAKNTSSNGGETLLSGKKAKEETQLAPSKPTANMRAFLIADGKEYPLSIGDNTVGRKAPTSQASVQIDTSDRYMSRQHAKIMVTRMSDGSLHSVISNDHNKNISTIDGQDLLQGDAIILNDGDSIVMGTTTVTYREA